MNEKEQLPSENVAKSATNDESPRHGGSIPLTRCASESSTYESSVEPSVEESALAIIDFARSLTGSKPPLVERTMRVQAPSGNEIATEAGHWYLPDGTPFYTVPRKSKGKNGEPIGSPRAVNLGFDRKLMYELGVVPSSTGIVRQLNAPALNAYRDRQVFEGTIKALVGSDEVPEFVAISGIVIGDPEDLFKRAKILADEHRDNAAARGTSLHTAIEASLRGDGLVDDRWSEHIVKLWATLDQYGIDLTQGESERSFAHPLGYGGKCDYHELAEDEPTDVDETGNYYPGLVIDFKSKDEIDDSKQIAGDEHVMQIASYANGLLIPDARGINVFVGENDCEIRIHEWNASDMRRGWELFQLLLQVWKIKNKYYPPSKP